MAKIIVSGNRNVAAIRKSNIFASDTHFHETPLTFLGRKKGSPAAIAERRIHRKSWLQDALNSTKNCDVVFFDPDNGLEVKSHAFHHDKGAKFTFYEELLPFYQRGQTLVIYQHKNLHQTARFQVEERSRELCETLNCANVHTVYFPSHSGRMFFIVPAKGHDEKVASRYFCFMEKWAMHVRDLCENQLKPQHLF